MAAAARSSHAATYFSRSVKSLTTTTDTPRGWNDHGGALFAAGRYAEALASFERAIVRSPLYVEAWVNKANTLFEAGERDAALPAGHRGPRPHGGVGGTRAGVKCLHAHYAYFLAGGGDPVGRWVAERLPGAAAEDA